MPTEHRSTPNAFTLPSMRPAMTPKWSFTLTAIALTFAACSDTPVAPVQDVEPSFAVEKTSDALIGWYTFDDGTATDGSRSGNHGTITGATPSGDTPKGDGQSLAFANGSGTPPSFWRPHASDYVTIPEPSVLPDDGITLAGWVRAEADSSMVLVAKQLGAGVLNSFALYRRGDQPTGHQSGLPVPPLWSFVVTLDDGTPEGHAIGISILADTPGVWRHIAGTWDGAAMSLYVDGQLAKAVPAPAGSILYSGNPVYIGADENSGIIGVGWKGNLDNVGVFDRALTDGEVAALAAHCPPQSLRATPAGKGKGKNGSAGGKGCGLPTG